MKVDATNESSYREAERLIAEARSSGAKHLALDSLRIVDLPESIGSLAQLESLDLSQCLWLTDISPLSRLTALQSLDLSWCSQIADIATLQKLTALQSLDLSGCEQIADIAPLQKLTTLQSLDLSWCEQIADFAPLQKLTALQSLDLSGCKQITDITLLQELIALQTLDLFECKQIADFAPLQKLTALQSLNLSGCEQIADFTSLQTLTALLSLDLSWCEQIADFAPLQKLTALQSLDLSGCKQIADLAPLQKLTALQSLDLFECKQIADLAPLQKLTALQSLDLSGCEQIADFAALQKLTALQSLDLSWFKQIADIIPLQELTTLQSLGLSGCEQITDIAPLQKLTALQSLNLSGCEQIADLAPLQKLTVLQSLNLSGCEQIADIAQLKELTALQSLRLSGCKQIADIAPLQTLTALQSLDLSECEKIADIAPLKELTALQSLHLSGCKQIADIAPLQKLTALHSLHLSGCKQIADIAPLQKLTALHSLDIRGAVVLSDAQNAYLQCCRNLRHLVVNTVENSRLLYGFPRLTTVASYDADLHVGNAPAELFEGKDYENLLPSIVAWQQDILSSSAAPNTELKVFVLGNGRVGKTQVSRRLQGLPYDASIPSTHGVTLGRYKALDADGSYAAMHLNLWDFGGQDIYLGTHGLFLDDRAIYVVAWHPKHEDDREFFVNGVPMRNRPLGYWLSYVRSLAGKNAPIIVVQTQCDEGDEEVPPPIPSEHGFGCLKSTACSAQADYGMERLVPEIRNAARLLRKRYAAVEIPQSWVAMESLLRSLRDEGRKTLPFEEFATLCKERNSLAPPSFVAGFLHRAGQVFWREGAFGNDLVLQQDWALEGIYALLERSDTLPMIRECHGRFHLAQLQVKAWKNYREGEQRLFLDMMTQCGTCFRLNKETYVAAELLPSERAVEADIEAIWRGAEPDALVELHYDFLHDGVIKNVLCRIGEKAGINGVYWQAGVCYYDREAHGAVQIRAVWDEGQSTSRCGRIEVRVEGTQASRLARHLVASIESIRLGGILQTIWRRGEQDVEESRQLTEQKALSPFSAIAPLGTGNSESASGSATAPAAFSSGQQNILLLATEWESRHGGLSTLNRELCLALARAGKTVCCAVPGSDTPKCLEVGIGRVHIVFSGNDTLVRKLPLPEGFTPDIIIGHGRITGQAAKAQQEDYFPRAKRVHFIHMAPGQIEWYKGKSDAAIQAGEREKQELELARCAQLVAAVGPRLYREMSTVINRLKASERPKVCRFDPGFIQSETQSVPQSLHCLLVGRAEDEALKGIDIAACALGGIDKSQLPHPPELIIRGAPVGEGTSLRNGLTSRFDGVPIRVREYSADSEEIGGDYRSAAITLMPSRSEGFGLVALESLRYGTPVLISNESGLAELLGELLKSHERQHYIVETPDDLEQAALKWRAAIYSQISDIEAAINRANKLCKILAERLTWPRSCELLLKEIR
jgi:internalin A